MRFALLSLSLLWSQLFKADGLRQADGISSSNQQRVMMLSEMAMNGGGFDVQDSISPVTGDQYGVSGSLPRKFQCYSCMSLSYQNNWSRLQHLYVQPKIFTDRCERPADYEKMPTVECGSVCVSLVEADMEGGVFLGFKYIRGCINRILMHDFNLSALRTHRMTQSDLCRSLPRAVLFNNPRTAPQVFGEVNLCTCFGEKCNSATQSIASAKESSSRLILSALLLFLFHRIF